MVTILMSTFNGEKYLVEQLESIFNQSYQDFVLVVRDDGSSDDTYRILLEFRRNLSNPDKMKISKGENLGFCASFYELLKDNDIGDYWAFSDQDDVWHKDKLKHAIEWLDAQDQSIPLMYHSGFEIVDDCLVHVGTYPLNKKKYTFKESVTSSIFFGFSMVISKETRDMFLMCDVNKIQSHDWFISMIVAGFGAFHSSLDVDSKHRLHLSNTSPTSVVKKLPLFFRMLTSSESYYTRQAMEYKRLYENKLSADNRAVLDLFDLEVHKFRKSMVKFFFPHRWNRGILEEVAIRILMLLGKI